VFLHVILFRKPWRYFCNAAHGEQGGSIVRSESPEADLALAQSADTTPWFALLLQKCREIFRGAPVFSLFFLVIALACAVFAPFIAPYSPVITNPTNILQAPNFLSSHVLGTDNQGRDILSRLIYGT
jgi:ABC-type dipeptide/oligopeptide/nickel transport system permease subunit